MKAGTSVSGVRERRPPFHFESGAIYDGEWLNNMRDGQGS